MYLHSHVIALGYSGVLIVDYLDYIGSTVKVIIIIMLV